MAQLYLAGSVVSSMALLDVTLRPLEGGRPQLAVVSTLVDPTSNGLLTELQDTVRDENALSSGEAVIVYFQLTATAKPKAVGPSALFAAVSRASQNQAGPEAPGFGVWEDDTLVLQYDVKGAAQQVSVLTRQPARQP